MNFRTFLSLPSSLKQIHLVRDEIIQHPHYFFDVFELIFEKENKHAWRAAWAIEKVSEKEASFFSDKEIIDLMTFSISIENSSLLRSVLSILINLPIPKNLPVEFINLCFEKTISMKESVAVQALSIKMLLRISEIEPDFMPEIIATLENVDITCVSAGYIAMRAQVLKHLYKKMKS